MKRQSLLGIDSLWRDKLIYQKTTNGPCPAPNRFDGSLYGYRYESNSEYVMHWKLVVLRKGSAPLISIGRVNIVVR